MAAQAYNGHTIVNKSGMPMASMQTDVVVVGGGASGLAAAISAATEGAQVLLIEKNPYLGGSARLSVGSINAAGSTLQKRVGITDTPDEHFADMDHFMGPYAALENRELRRILVDNVAGTLDWLMAMGLRFYGPTADPPHRHARMHNVLPNSRAYPWYLGREARRRGVQIVLDAPLESILGDTGGVTGVLARIDGERTEIHARLGVILASGDYSNGRELKREFRPELEAVSAVNPTATGDGQRIGRQFGARIVNGQVIWGPSLRFAEPATPSLVRRLPPVPLLVGAMDLALRWLPQALFRPFILSFMTSSLGPELGLLGAGAILVNKAGQRFCDELQAPGPAIAQQPGQSAFFVFDDQVARQFSAPPHHVSTAPGVGFAYLPDYQRNRRDLSHAGPTLAALADSLGVPADALAQAVAAHNAAVAADPQGRAPITQAPFHALGPVQTRIVITDGGLAVNTRHQVLRQDDQPIPRLYAVGATGQGGLLLAGNGHHIGWATTSGRRAGRFIVRGAGDAG
jgi:fumarate reductase flavoprotein subunit